MRWRRLVVREQGGGEKGGAVSGRGVERMATFVNKVASLSFLKYTATVERSCSRGNFL
jgi:hypothetical protein